ncbi:MAG: hypothetical protein WDM89_15170 [Rhizomicrobium sp.]
MPCHPRCNCAGTLPALTRGSSQCSKTTAPVMALEPDCEVQQRKAYPGYDNDTILLRGYLPSSRAGQGPARRCRRGREPYRDDATRLRSLRAHAR